MVKSLNVSNAVSCATTDADYNSANQRKPSSEFATNLCQMQLGKIEKKLRYSSLAHTTGFYWLCEAKLAKPKLE